MISLGLVFAFVARQLGRILTLAFNWATTILFGRVQQNQLVLSGMAAAAAIWPVILFGIIVPSFATFMLGFFTVPDWLTPWVRVTLIFLAIALPLLVGFLSSLLPAKEQRPRGRVLLTTILRGYPNSTALFIVIVWMMVVAPLGKLRAVLRRWESVHVPIAVQPGGYETVVHDLAAALQRAGIAVKRRRANWAYELPGKVLAALGGSTVRTLVPAQLWQLVGDGFEMTLHPMDLALGGRKQKLARARAAIVRELTFTAAYQTWTRPAQELEDRIAAAARGEDDLDDIGAELQRRDLAYEEWEILYRLIMQVRLRLNPIETDAIDGREEQRPPFAARVVGAIRVLAGLRNGRRPTSSRGGAPVGRAAGADD